MKHFMNTISRVIQTTIPFSVIQNAPIRVILNAVKNLFTSTNAYQILRVAQDDTKRCLCLVVTSLALLTSCDVHEWPEPAEPIYRTYHIRLVFDTDMDEQNYYYEAYSSRAMEDYEMRYILRAYPVESRGSARAVSRQSVWEHSIIRTVSLNEYDYELDMDIELPEGTYCLMVWTDFVKAGTDADCFYMPDDFAEITLFGEHKANTDMRDAFRGEKDFVQGMVDENGNPMTDILVEMKRPLAKYTFVTTDLQEFIEKEEVEARKRAEARGEEYDDSRSIDLEDYRVVFYYPGFMPSAYNMFTDRPSDSKTGVQFKSQLSAYNDSEASMGFDYVFVNGSSATVQVTVGLFDKDNNQISMSNPIDVPLNRGVNTIVRGKFLMMNADGGIGIDPSFDGDHNIIIP